MLINRVKESTLGHFLDVASSIMKTKENNDLYSTLNQRTIQSQNPGSKSYRSLWRSKLNKTKNLLDSSKRFSQESAPRSIQRTSRNKENNDIFKNYKFLPYNEEGLKENKEKPKNIYFKGRHRSLKPKNELEEFLELEKQCQKSISSSQYKSISCSPNRTTKNINFVKEIRRGNGSPKFFQKIKHKNSRLRQPYLNLSKYQNRVYPRMI